MLLVSRLLLLVALAIPAITAQAGMFVYELPDGTRLLTDHEVNDRNYRLIRTGRTTQGAGLLLAGQNRQFFRPDPDAYDNLIRRLSRKHKIDHTLVKAVMRVESAFNPYATSDKGAAGLMQLMPSTAEQYGVEDIYDPEQNISAGIRHLKYLLQRFKYKKRIAIAAYNAGEGAVSRYKGVPPYSETREYVRKVLRFKKHYASRFDRDA